MLVDACMDAYVHMADRIFIEGSGLSYWARTWAI